MTELMRSLDQFEPNWVLAPGETIAELLAEKSISQKELAMRMGVTPKYVNQLVAGKAPISEETALKLERVLGSKAGFWLRLELDYRASLARCKELEQAESWITWLDDKPYRALMNEGLIPTRKAIKSEKPKIVLDLLRYFGVASPNDWTNTYASMQAQFRKASKRNSDDMAVAAWLRIGERRAEKVVPAPYSKKKFQQALDQIRSFTVLPPSKWQSQLIKLCANAGVAVVFVPAIPKSGVSGVARWLASDKALIQLSLYGKTNDKLWFTFFHEAAHILLHAKKNIFLDNLDASINNALEEEANRYARDTLIPPAYVSKLRFLSSAEDIKSYAANLGIHPGIVVGRMQFDRIAHFDRWNHLKDRYEFVQSAG